MTVEALPVILTALLTVLAPFITAFFTKTTMSSKLKNIIALVVSAVIAAVYVVMTGGFTDVTDYAVPVATIFGISQLIYQQAFKGLVKDVEANVGLKAKADLRAGAKG